MMPGLHPIVLALMMAVPPGAESPAESAPPGLSVEAIGQCPTGEAVSAALKGAVVGALDHSAGTARVADLGDRFEITVLGETRQYADPGRDCDERARVAAVFIALALNPPTFVAPPRPPPPPPNVETPVPVVPAARGPGRYSSVGLAFRADGATADGTSVLAPGAELRAALGWRVFGLAASAGILAPTETRLVSVPVREQRFPLALAATARWPLSSVLVGGAAVGAALVPFTMHGEGLSSPEPATRLDAGARFDVQLAVRRPAGRFAPFFDFHAEIFPRTYVVAVGPLGELGSTAHLWLGLSLGVALETSR